MGAVAEMLRKRGSREPRAPFSSWGLLWVLPVGGVFLAAVGVIPQTGSRWLDVLVWSGYGLFWGAIALVGERAVRRARHLEPARGLFPRPIGLVVMCTVIFAGRPLVPKGSDLWTGVPGGVAFVVVVVVDRILRAREARH